MATFSQELFDRICERIADGESLRGICRDDDMPAPVTVLKWVSRDDALAKQYARAREASADADADDMKDIAARTVSGEIDPQAARVQIDVLKWSAGKRKPKVYGDKLDVDLNGSLKVETVAVEFRRGRDAGQDADG